MRIMISCGEASGDLYAGALAAEIRRREPGAEIFGFGGDRLRAAGGELIGHLDGFAVTGLIEALRVVPRSLGMLRRLIHAARARRPDVFVAVDFPDFNFRLMKALRRQGVPVVYYISPQLWAWRPGRMRTMKAHVDRVLVIFPFEEPLYREAGVDVRFVGHPLVDLAKARQPRDAFRCEHGLDPETPVVALLPGSRASELRHIAPTIGRAVPIIRRHVPGVRFVVACAPGLPRELFRPLLDGHPLLLHGRTDDVLVAADVAITASGTATVQCALHERPMVVVYRLSPLTYALGRPFVKVNTYAMANLVAGERIVPELIQHGFTPERVAEETLSLLGNRDRHARMRAALARVRERLGAPGASGRAAEAVLDIARCGGRR